MKNLLIFFAAVLMLSVFNSCSRDDDWEYKKDLDPESWTPFNLQSNRLSFSEVQISWDQNDTDIEGFIIEGAMDETRHKLIADLPKGARSYILTLDDFLGHYLSLRICAKAGEYRSGYCKKYLSWEIPGPTYVSSDTLCPNVYQFKWEYDNIYDAEGFRIVRGLFSMDYKNELISTDWEILADLPLTTTSYIDSAVFPKNHGNFFSMTYYVRAYNGDYTTAECRFFGDGLQSIAEPRNAKIIRQNEHTVNIVWKTPSIYNHDIIFQRLDRSQDPAVFVDIATVKMDDEMVQDDRFEMNQEVKYNLKTVSGEYYMDLPWLYFYSGPAAPELTVSHTGESTVSLSWIFPPNGIDGYKIDRKINEGDWELDYATVEDPEDCFFEDIALDLNSNSYTYRVYAYSSVYESCRAETSVGNNKK